MTSTTEWNVVIQIFSRDLFYRFVNSRKMTKRMLTEDCLLRDAANLNQNLMIIFVRLHTCSSAPLLRALLSHSRNVCFHCVAHNSRCVWTPCFRCLSMVVFYVRLSSRREVLHFTVHFDPIVRFVVDASHLSCEGSPNKKAHSLSLSVFLLTNYRTL